MGRAYKTLAALAVQRKASGSSGSDQHPAASLKQALFKDVSKALAQHSQAEGRVKFAELPPLEEPAPWEEGGA